MPTASAVVRSGVGVCCSVAGTVLDLVVIVYTWLLDFYNVSESYYFRCWVIVGTALFVISPIAEAVVHLSLQQHSSVSERVITVAANVVTAGVYLKLKYMRAIIMNRAQITQQIVFVIQLYRMKLVEVLEKAVRIVFLATALALFLWNHSPAEEAVHFGLLVGNWAVAAVVASLSVSGFALYCPPSAWSHVRDQDPNNFRAPSGNCWRGVAARACSYLPFLDMYLLFSVLSSMVVYTYVAVYGLVVSDQIPGVPVLVFIIRWIFHLGNLWAACWRHRREVQERQQQVQASAWRASVWMALVSAVTFVPWSIPGTRKWGLTFWLNIGEATVFTVGPNAFLIANGFGSRADGDDVYLFFIAAFILCLFVPVGGVYFQQKLWQQHPGYTDVEVPNEDDYILGATSSTPLLTAADTTGSTST